MKLSFENTRKFNRGTFDGWVYNTKEDFPDISGAYIEVTGRHGKFKSTESDLAYFVIAGEGEFFVGDDAYSVKEKDMVIIPKNTPCDYKTTGGKLKLFLLHTPAFDRDKEVRLEN